MCMQYLMHHVILSLLQSAKKKWWNKGNISEPLPNLKRNTKMDFREYFLYRFEISPYAKAYVKNRSIKDNVRFHRRQRKVLSLDVKDFLDI